MVTLQCAAYWRQRDVSAIGDFRKRVQDGGEGAGVHDSGAAGGIQLTSTSPAACSFLSLRQRQPARRRLSLRMRAARRPRAAAATRLRGVAHERKAQRVRAALLDAVREVRLLAGLRARDLLRVQVAAGQRVVQALRGRATPGRMTRLPVHFSPTAGTPSHVRLVAARGRRHANPTRCTYTTRSRPGHGPHGYPRTACE